MTAIGVRIVSFAAWNIFVLYSAKRLTSVSEIAKDMFDDRDVRNAYIEFIEPLARVFVEEHWREIEAVARELAELGTLTDDQVRAVMLRDADTCPAWLKAA